jgi:hypothetical protein
MQAQDYAIRLAPAAQEQIQSALGLSDEGFAALQARWTEVGAGYAKRPFKRWSFEGHFYAAHYIAKVLSDKRVRGVTWNFEADSTAYGAVALRFANDKTRFDHSIRQVFKDSFGVEVADIHREMAGMWTWVLTSDGNLWLHDKSHGGGGEFTLVPTRKH